MASQLHELVYRQALKALCLQLFDIFRSDSMIPQADQLINRQAGVACPSQPFNEFKTDAVVSQPTTSSSGMR